MITVWSCHLITNRKLPDDRTHIRDFIDADFSLGKYFYSIFEMDFIHKHYNSFSLLCSLWENIKYFYRQCFHF